jgi:triacylglycerol lipase
MNCTRSFFLPRILGILLSLTAMTPATEHVILLHGLCRTTRSMSKMERSLTAEGYTVHNISYPTRKKSVQDLAEEHLKPLLGSPQLQDAEKIHFVTHSIGGIVLRHYLGHHEIKNLGRLVLLGPPNQGSEVVDKIGHWKLFRAIHGPAGQELGTNPKSTPNQLGPLRHTHGVIAGSRSINWINSLMIKGPDDGKVSVASTRISDTSHHLVMPVTHPYLMRNRRAIAQTSYYLKNGKFQIEE